MSFLKMMLYIQGKHELNFESVYIFSFRRFKTFHRRRLLLLMREKVASNR